MIIQEHFQLNGVEFIRSFSDKGVYIRGGFPEADYEESLDPASCSRSYVETDIPIEGGSEDADKAEAYDILMGEEE